MFKNSKIVPAPGPPGHRWRRKAKPGKSRMQNNFGRRLSLVVDGIEVIATKNGKEAGRFLPRESAVSYLILSYLMDSLTGILSVK